ncbi:juvenile hormone epoxide hydrolase-like [Pectinophora gossypiella]|uniref:juvenile hormone epoxide hydrolase-like n=1 Tax=Pectinophora gossypiella TaxID=13191 RepID=UPI00214F3A36|nr:juvenile hormone epoxide hydrolase-like [Pectinophora gossypiella]
MVRCLLIVSVILAVVTSAVYFQFLRAPPLPALELDQWWGPERLREKQDDSVRPFRVKFKETMLQDLREYFKVSRELTPPLEGVGFEYGFRSEVAQKWLKYWAEEYPFAEREKFFNQYSNYRTYIQGLSIHFIHVKPEVPKGTELVPVLLLHGWPGSVREFYEAIPLLTAVDSNRNFALELIIPSLPGYGFSDAAVRPGLGAAEMAVVLRNLMHRLGYKQFYVQGGDWGSMIGSHMATLFPKEVLGYHTNMPMTMAPVATLLEVLFSFWPTLVVEPQLVDRLYPLSARFNRLLQETGYMHIQSTKPDTLGVALSDSPVGLLAYILEKFSTWTDFTLTSSSDGGLTKHFTREQLIDNIMVYWSTQSITTSMRLYSETFNKRHSAHNLDKIPTSVPTWALQAKYELAYQPPFILRFKYPYLLNTTVLEDGGHFLALQLPRVFSQDVLKAVAAFRDWHKKNAKSEL